MILDEVKEKTKYHGMHVEVVTNIIPGFNDDDRELRGIASWIKISLGEDTPWHVTRFYPHLHLSQGVPNAAQKFQGLSPFK